MVKFSRLWRNCCGVVLYKFTPPRLESDVGFGEDTRLAMITKQILGSLLSDQQFRKSLLAARNRVRIDEWRSSFIDPFTVSIFVIHASPGLRHNSRSHICSSCAQYFRGRAGFGNRLNQLFSGVGGDKEKRRELVTLGICDIRPRDSTGKAQKLAI